MSNDLVARLRELNTFEWHARPATTKETCFAAADRIERLEKALLEISNAVGDPSAYWIARTALEKTDD